MHWERHAASELRDAPTLRYVRSFELHVNDECSCRI